MTRLCPTCGFDSSDPGNTDAEVLVEADNGKLGIAECSDPFHRQSDDEGRTEGGSSEPTVWVHKRDSELICELCGTQIAQDEQYVARREDQPLAHLRCYRAEPVHGSDPSEDEVVVRRQNRSEE